MRLQSAARHWFAQRSDGDFARSDDADHPGHGVPPRPWTWLHQVHGADVVTVQRPGEHQGAHADAAVTATPGCALLIRTADCAPVALHSEGMAGAQGVVGLVHAGWRGLEAGVLEATVAAMARLGAQSIRADLGPCIGPECYQFGPVDLDRLTDRFGPAARGKTDTGDPALDLRRSVGVVLDRLGVELENPSAPCTACGADQWFSHRGRGDAGRQASFAWLAS